MRFISCFYNSQAQRRSIWQKWTTCPITIGVGPNAAAWV